MIRVGTSGFSYQEWKPDFYPEGLAQAKFLSYYAEHFPTTEINNTFYRSPSPKTVSGWAGKVPGHFRFALKANRRITHHKRLEDVEENMEWFLKGAAPLEERLGCILVQLPPWLPRKLERLESFLKGFAQRAPLAFEFRHDSWFEEETYSLLERHGSALAVVEADEREAVRRLTGDFVYVRLRRSDYCEDSLTEWADWLGELDRDAYVYLKHAGKAPALAAKLRDLAGASA